MRLNTDKLLGSYSKSQKLKDDPFFGVCGRRGRPHTPKKGLLLANLQFTEFCSHKPA